MLNPDFKEFLQSLNDNSVKYLVVGGYAVAIHGHPRYTKELDVWIEISQANAEGLVRALSQFVFASLGLTDKDFLDEDTVIQLGYPPSRIDILTSIDGISFGECYPSRLTLAVDGVSIDCISIADLRRNKAASARPQDLADLDNLT